MLASGRGPADALAEAQSLRAKCVPSLKCVADGASDRRAEYASMITCITQKSIDDALSVFFHQLSQPKCAQPTLRECLLVVGKTKEASVRNLRIGWFAKERQSPGEVGRGRDDVIASSSSTVSSRYARISVEPPHSELAASNARNTGMSSATVTEAARV